MNLFAKVMLLGCVAYLSAPAGIAARLNLDFNASNPWPAASTYASPAAATASLRWGPLGSYDTAGSATPSPALALTVDATAAGNSWTAGFSSERLAVATGETRVDKLTLNFDLAASAARPVLVRITSFDGNGARSGALEGFVYPAAPNFIHRHTLDLGSLTPSGPGQFSATDPSLQISFEISGPNQAAWPAALNQVVVDNLAYSGPAFYVSPQGSDQADGRSEQTAFATPQRAIDVAQAGDIILVMNGNYFVVANPVASFVRAGTPAAWIVLKNYPGHQPTLGSSGWNIINIARGSATQLSPVTLAYLEVRGLHVRGEGDVAANKYPSALNQADSRVNSNGIAVDGRYMANVPHHVRFADNLVEYAPGQGIGSLEGDWVTIENNTCRNNSWTTIYATSGISILGASNFDAADGVYKVLVRNNDCHGNQTFYKWKALDRFSDGNGIILDVNKNTSTRPNGRFLGRTLVQGNLCYNNGGSGIHAFTANRVDIVNNTAYLNSASPELQYPQLYAGSNCDDVRIVNNIIVAPVANVAAGEKPEPLNTVGNQATNIVHRNNLFFGGNVAPVLGEAGLVADPRFVNPSRDPAVANFRLRPESPARDAGASQPPAGAPIKDLAGQARPQGSGLDLGALEFTAGTQVLTAPQGRLVAPGKPLQLFVGAVGDGLVYQWFRDGAILPGETGREILRTAATAADAGAYTVRVSGSDGQSMITGPAIVALDPGAARVVNLSCRTRLAGNASVILGFAISGTGEKSVLVRAIGPTLAGFGVQDPMKDPQFTLYRGSTPLLANDKWNTTEIGDAFTRVGAFALPPGSADAAARIRLPAPGTYTVVASGVTGGGVVLVEIYDLEPSANAGPQLVNASVRGQAGSGDDSLILGLAVAGAGQRSFLVRGVGPALIPYGVPRTLGDPRIDLFDSSNQRRETNNDWGQFSFVPLLQRTAELVGAFSFLAGSKDAAMLVPCSAGTYTAIATGADGGTGETLIEVYEAP